jgi:hypothetical protein
MGYAWEPLDMELEDKLASEAKEADKQLRARAPPISIHKNFIPNGPRDRIASTPIPEIYTTLTR